MKLKEGMWRVSLTTGGPNPQDIERPVQAMDQNMAIQRASGMYPNLKFIRATATALDAATHAPSETPGPDTQNGLDQLTPGPQVSHPMVGLKQPVGLRGLGENKFDIKRLKYPYSITLPLGLSHVLRETSPVPIRENYGQYKISLKENDMKVFIKNLLSHKDKYAVRTILTGLRSTLR